MTRRARTMFHAAALATAMLPRPLLASYSDSYFVGPTNSLYSDPANWSPSPPGPSDQASVSTTTDFSIVIDGTPNPAGMNGADFEGYSPSSLTVGQSAGTFNVNYLRVGPDATYSLSNNGVITATASLTVYGGIFNQLGGSVGAPNTDLHVGSDTASSFYNFSGGSITAAILRLDGNASAVFTQTAGSLTTRGGITVGANDTYLMTGGTLTSRGTIQVGYYTGGTRQSGSAFYQYFGNVTYDPVFANTYALVVESVQGSTALYSLAGGTLQLASAGARIGYTNSATFNQSGGSFSGSLLTVADAASSTASYSLTSGSVQFDTLRLANAGRATFSQSGGGATFTSVYLAPAANSSATYILADGFLSSTSTSVGAAGSAYFDQTGGTHTTSSLTIGSPGHADPQPTYDLIGGALVTSNVVNYGVFFTQYGALTLTGPHPTFTNYASATFAAGQYWPANSSFVNAGSATFRSDPGNTPTLAVSSTGPLAFDTTYVHLASLALSAGSHASYSPAYPDSGFLYSNALSIADTAQLDLVAGTLVLDYASTSPLETIRSLIRTGQLRSSSADSTHALACAEAAALPAATAARLARASAFDATTLLITLAIVGDANLDGKLDADDYALVDRGYARHASTWQGGDFDYDGAVTSADYFLIDRAFAIQSGVLSPDLLSLRESQFGNAYVAELVASVPEPSVSACLAATVSLVTRRRRQ